VALDAAIMLARRRPGDDLLDWLARIAGNRQSTWSTELTDKLLDVIERGNARSWRFLDTTGVLDVALPEVAAAFKARQSDSFSLDPLNSHRVVSMERLRMLNEDEPIAVEVHKLEHVDQLLLATWLAEVLEDDPDPGRAATTTLKRLLLPESERVAIEHLVEDRDLLWSAARQPGALGELPVLALAAHLDTPERARALYILSALHAEGRERWELTRLATLHDLLQATLADDQLSGVEARNLAEQRRHEAAAHLQGAPDALKRVADAPPALVLRQPPDVLARLARLLDPPLRRHQTRVSVSPGENGGWWIDVGAHDRPGLLAVITGVLADASLAVDDAVLAAWPDGVVLDTFLVTNGLQPDADSLSAAIQANASTPLNGEPLPDAEIDFDNAASPWHTVCEVRATDRPRLLHSLATAFAAAGVDVRAATVSAADELVIDRFELVGGDGEKLRVEDQQRLRDLIRIGVLVRRRRLGHRLSVRSPRSKP
jgi:[protein-PII] uridylyltransferase